MKDLPEFDVVVIGSGPGGYVCAIRCAQLGLSVAIIEKEPHLGGTCLNIGCIPSKALLHSTELYQQVAHGDSHGIMVSDLKIDIAKLMQRKESVINQLRKGIATLMQQRKIEVFAGMGSFVDATTVAVSHNGEEKRLRGKNIVIATGSTPVALPFLKPDGKIVVTSEEALSFDAVPASMLVIGGGAIGLEMGSVWSRLGCEVTVIEFLPTIAAGSDPDVSKMAERIFKKQGLKIQTATQVVGCQLGDNGATLTCKHKDKEVTFSAEKVLLSVGRKPFTAGLALENAGLATDDKGRLPTEHLQTKVKGIWAIGDVIAGPMLAHKAEEDGVAVANAIAGKYAHVDYSRVPNVIYTHPEIASVGLTEAAAKEKNIAVSIGKFPLAANGRAIAQDATDGFAKIIACAKTDKLLGATIISAGASEMIASVVAHMEYGGSAEDLGNTVHAHPTISEAVKEAALAVNKAAIHGA